MATTAWFNRFPFGVGAARLLRGAWLVCALLAVSRFSGCAAVSNPVAQGIPVRLVPSEILAEPREAREQIPLSWLSREPDGDYLLGPGDILGVHIDGILGDPNLPPPVTVPEVASLPPAVGVPIPIREDGTIPLPRIDPVNLTGLTIIQAEQEIINAYSVKRQLVKPREERILITLVRPRHERILVIRQDNPTATPFQGGGQVQDFRGLTSLATTSITQQQGTGTVVDLPANENDVLNALTRTGGLPGPAAKNEVIIQRGGQKSRRREGWARDSRDEIIRIPLRRYPGQSQTFSPEDIILQTGDIVFVEARRPEVYYTAGLLPAREIPLPRDIDITAIEAISRVGGPLVNGGVNSNNLTGQLINNGLGYPSPSLLSVIRRTSDGRQVVIRVDVNRAFNDPRENLLIAPGDVLVLQETTGEASTRYFTNLLRIDAFGDVFRTGSGSASLNTSFP